MESGFHSTDSFVNKTNPVNVEDLKQQKRQSPARRCPTTSARLPFFTLVMKAPSLPVSVIFPPTTCRQVRGGLLSEVDTTFAAKQNYPSIYICCSPSGPAGTRPHGAEPTSCLAWCVRSGGRPLWTAATSPGAAGNTENRWGGGVNLELQVNSSWKVFILTHVPHCRI